MAADPRNLSDPAAYSGIAAERALRPLTEAEQAAASPGRGASETSALARFHEILVQTGELDWVEKTLAGLSHKMLWRDEETGASIALVRFAAGSGIPSRHAHASNQFMFCLSGRYAYTETGLTLIPGSFYWNPKGCLHGPTLAEEDSVLLEVYDGPHYATQPDWYESTEDAR
ncbi:MAG: cupin domain-containing protein [Solirubrobacteraceae bacterium]